MNKMTGVASAIFIKYIMQIDHSVFEKLGKNKNQNKLFQKRAWRENIYFSSIVNIFK